MAGPLLTRPLAEVRDVVEAFISTHPEHPLACRLDAVSGHWLPVQPAELERYRPALDSPAPLNAIIAPDGIVTYLSHAAGDAATLTGVVSGLVLADPAQLAALERRAVLGDALGALARQRPTTYLAWLRRAIRTVRPMGKSRTPIDPSPTATAVRRGPQSNVVVGVLSNAELRSLTRWRNQHHPGASLTAVLASRVCLGFAAAGLPMRRSGFYSLFDIRSTLPGDGPTFGNLAKSLFLTADLADPSTRLERMLGRDDRGRVDSVAGPWGTARSPSRSARCRPSRG